MAMRGILVAVACAVVVGGCACSALVLSGEPDVTTDFAEDVSPDLHSDAVPDPADEEDEEAVAPDTCGNGVIDPGEECDDGDEDDCNGCTTECVWERAMRIAGETPGALVPDERTLCVTRPFTIEGWFKVESERGHASMLYIPGFYDIQVSRFAHYQVRDWGDGGISSNGYSYGALGVGSWHHIALIGTSGSPTHILIFIDGHFNQMLTVFDTWTCDGPVSMGGPSEFADSPFVTFDDIRISDSIVYEGASAMRDFTPELYLDPGPDTVALWRFNDEEDGILVDASGNGHDAELLVGELVPDDCHLSW